VKSLAQEPGRSASARWIALRNRLLADSRFQRWAARLPVFAAISRRRAASLFDLVAGFTYSQILAAVVDLGLLDLLGDDGMAQRDIQRELDLSPDATSRLLHAAEALDLVEQAAAGWWMLGQQGAVLRTNPGAQAMIAHHKLLYADLALPVELLRDDRRSSTALSRFWTYSPAPGGQEIAYPYSDLMARSQAMVTEQLLDAYRFDRHTAVLDVGGGHGVFAHGLAQRYPQVRVGLFDLPSVIAGTRERFSHLPSAQDIALYQGSFFEDALPGGYDCISLVRILHDHDDGPALDLLKAIRRALPRGGRLVIGEPLAGTPGARAMGGAYFGMYLWAMRSGRPRTRREIGTLLMAAGFTRIRPARTSQPIIASVIVASY
jgi:demethylspheroidene O-methyltransferase